MRIILTGAQGTGKTTLLNSCKNMQINLITEVARKLYKNGIIKINENGDEISQRILFNEYKKLLSDTHNYISDRGLTDVFSYTEYLKNKNIISENFYNKQLNDLKEFLINNRDIIYIYLPIEFEIKCDGIRSLNKEFQYDIDKIIKNNLIKLNIDFIEIKGTVEDRIDILKNILYKNNA